MSSTATGDAAETAARKAAKRHGKKAPAAAGKQTAKKKKAAAPDARAIKPASGTGKTSGIRVKPDPAIAVPDSPTEDDPRSLAWMSAQAVNALNAVREHQAEQARELLARADKPPARHTALSDQPVEPGETAATGEQAGSTPAPQPATEHVPVAGGSEGLQPDSAASPVAASMPHSPDNGIPASITHPVEPAPPTAPVTPAAPQAASESPSPEVASTRPQDKAPAPASGGQEHVTPAIPTAPPPNRSALSPAVLAGIIAVTGLLVYWSWPGTDDTAPARNQPPALNEQASSIVDVPQPAAISVVAGKPASPAPAPATGNTPTPATEPARPAPESATAQPAATDRTGPVSTTPQADRTAPASAAVATDPAAPSPAGESARKTAVQPAAPVQPAATDRTGPASNTPQQDRTAPASAAVAADPAAPSAAPSPAGESVRKTTVQPAPPVPPAATARPPAATTRPAAPQPRYQAPGYGQYPQQPGWQQPYYRQSYPQYPSR